MREIKPIFCLMNLNLWRTTIKLIEMKVYLCPTGLDQVAKDMLIEQMSSLGYKVDTEKKESCDFLIYCVNPGLKGIEPIIDVIDNSNNYPSKTIFCYLEGDQAENGFNPHQVKSLVAVGKMVKRNGAEWYQSLESLLEKLHRYIAVT